MNKAPLLLLASIATAPAFAQNDTCATATPVTAGVAVPVDTTSATMTGPAWPCAGNGGPEIWFSYTPMQGGMTLVAETCGSGYDTAIEVFVGTCGSLVSLACNDDFCGLQSSVKIPSSTAGMTYYYRVGGWAGSTGTGTFVVNEVITDCSVADMFEDSDDCTTAAAIGDGMYNGLNVHAIDQDYYAVGLDAGATLDATILFIDAVADVDIYLWDPNVSCDTNVVGTGATTGWLARGFSATDNETIQYTNTTGGPQNLIIEIDMFTGNGCNTYDLILSGTNGAGGGIGSNYCMANANSTGMTGLMAATGSRVVANNDVTLSATQLPANATTFFITSQTQGFVPNPNGSQGNLCLGGAIGRYVGPGQIQNSGAMGEASLTIDLTITPTPTGLFPAMAGETHNYQAWHRDSDMGVPVSNFTDGYAIMYI